MTRRTMAFALAAAVLLSAGCGDDNNDSNAAERGDSAAAAAADSAYCDAAIDWAIHELSPFDETDPAAFESYWAEFEAFEAEALASSPEELEADWELKIEKENETIDVVLEKYDYDLAVMMEEGTPEEEAAFEAPPDVAAAQDRIRAYESAVCGAGFPAPADVSCAGEEPGSYCELVGAGDEQAVEALASGDPATIEEFVTAQAESNPPIVEAAPEVIKGDVIAVSAWTLGRQADVIEAHGWDVAAVMRDGTAQDRFDLNFVDEDIREEYARTLAYEQQVCGA